MKRSMIKQLALSSRREMSKKSAQSEEMLAKNLDVPRLDLQKVMAHKQTERRHKRSKVKNDSFIKSPQSDFFINKSSILRSPKHQGTLPNSPRFAHSHNESPRSLMTDINQLSSPTKTETHFACLKKADSMLLTSPEPEKFEQLNDDFLARIDEDAREL